MPGARGYLPPRGGGAVGEGEHGTAADPKQRISAELLGGGMTRREAAERVGVHENTVSNWLRLGAFRTARDEAVDALVLEMRP